MTYKKVSFIKRAPRKICWRVPGARQARGYVKCCLFLSFLRTPALPWQFFSQVRLGNSKSLEMCLEESTNDSDISSCTLMMHLESPLGPEMSDIFIILAPLEHPKWT